MHIFKFCLLFGIIIWGSACSQEVESKRINKSIKNIIENSKSQSNKSQEDQKTVTDIQRTVKPAEFQKEQEEGPHISSIESSEE